MLLWHCNTLIQNCLRGVRLISHSLALNFSQCLTEDTILKLAVPGKCRTEDSASPSELPGSAASASFKSCLETQNVRPRPKLTESEILEAGPGDLCFKKSLGDADAYEHLRTANVGTCISFENGLRLLIFSWVLWSSHRQNHVRCVKRNSQERLGDSVG